MNKRMLGKLIGVNYASKEKGSKIIYHNGLKCSNIESFKDSEDYKDECRTGNSSNQSNHLRL